MQKALVQMNVRLTNVVKDITGVTGMRIIRDIVAGQRDPATLAQHRDHRCKRSQEEIAKALEGNYRPELVFTLQQALELFDFYSAQITACDHQIEQLYAQFDPQVDADAHPLKPRKRKRNAPEGNEPDFNLRLYLYLMTGVDLTQIDGINALTAQILLSEIGLDMSKWPTVKHFTSWLHLCPYNDVSGGKVLKRGTKKTQNRATYALRMAATSLSRSNSALGAFYRRMRAKFGPVKANTATAHKLARIIYFMLKRREEYVDPGESYYQEKYRERVVRNLGRKAKALGFQLVPIPSEA
jgi:transposase